MFLQLDNAGVSLHDPYNFNAFKLCIVGDRGDIEAHRIALGPIAVLEDESIAWVRVHGLETWPNLQGYPKWVAGVRRMTDYAKGKGWYDAERGCVRAHIEWISRHDADVSAQDLVAGFRKSMRKLASSVTIVTTTESGMPHGMTATAVMSVSFEPLSLAVAINKSASIYEPLLRNGKFCVNVLSSAHAELCKDFSGRKLGIERFADGSWVNSPGGLPMLSDAQASLVCTVDATLDYGTHCIVVGRLDDVVNADLVNPLVYLDGAFAGGFAVPSAKGMAPARPHA